jgi:hypothetical protein
MEKKERSRESSVEEAPPVDKQISGNPKFKVVETEVAPEQPVKPVWKPRGMISDGGVLR